MAKKARKTEREELSEACKLLTKLLMHEASGGIIPLPDGVGVYIPPPIPFTERRALLDSVSKGLIMDMKVNPESEESGFDLLKGVLNESRKRGSGKTGSGALSPTDGGTEPRSFKDTFAGGSAGGSQEDE